MKDQNFEEDQQVATDDRSVSRESQAQSRPYEQPDQARPQETPQQVRQDSQQQQQMRQEFQPAGERQPTREQSSMSSGNGGLIGAQEIERFSSQWTGIQAAFVDEPKKAVEQADKLVEDVIQHLSTTFANERHKLEGQWSRGDSVSTEDLRVALQRYRQFFQSLLRT